jgi:hypothetical protein
MPIHLIILLLLVIFSNVASAVEPTAFTNEEMVCEKLSKKIPKTLSQARKISPLLKEITTPDLDYCHDNLSRCDLRTLVFNGFSLNLLHVKSSRQVFLHVARFSNLKKVEEFCGEECVSVAEYDENRRSYVIDCQANI